MASKAHAQQYPFGSVAPRVRRDVSFRREDPVVLPRSREWGIDFRLIGAALAATALVTAVTYGAFYSAPPELKEETPTQPLVRELDADVQLEQAHVVKALSGPAFAARSVAAVDQRPAEQELFYDAAAAARDTNAPISSTPQVSPEPIQSLERPEVFPQPTLPSSEKPSNPDVTPYPNPTTTPPDAIAPPNAPSDAPSPVLDSENPYR